MEIFWTPIHNGHNGDARKQPQDQRWPSQRGSASMTPSADVIETKDSLIVELDLPGYELEDIDVQLEGEHLTVQAQRTLTPAPDRTYHHSERSHGVQSRTFALPAIVDADQARATYRHGVLRLELPKRDEVKPRSIPVTVND